MASMSSIQTTDISLSKADIDKSAKLRQRLTTLHTVCFAFARAFPFRAMPYLCKRCAAAILPPIGRCVITPTVFGFDICVTPGAGENYYYLGFYELGTLRMMESMRAPGDTFVDVGASEGQMSARASQLVGDGGRVIALEPQARRFDDLVNTIRLNGFRNIIPLRLGAGSTPGEARLYTDIVSPSFRKTENPSRFETFEIRTLDEILRGHDVDEVTLMKIDVEGFELEVLKGSANTLSDDDAPAVCVEVGIGDVGHREVADTLSKYNDYHLYRLSRTKSCHSKLIPIGRCDEFSHHDNIFCIPAKRLRQIPREAFGSGN
jgi:FkbM family methyltransferase